MRSLFVEDSVDMGRELEIAGPEAAAEIRDSVSGRHVCPFCGAVREQAEGTCPRCTMENTAATRQATKSRLGPWYVLQTRNPAAPGMKFETLLAFVAKGRVQARSIVRGPTTHQLWRFAAHVKGLSREFGVCYSCGETVGKTANLCPHCNRPQDVPANPDTFLETQGADHPATATAPVFRDLGPVPMPAGDPMTSSLDAQAKTEAADPKPMPTRTDPRSMKKGADGFLTAADLAAAFKLDIQQPRERKQKKAAVSPIAMDRESPFGRAPRRKRRWFRAALLLLLAGAIGLAAWQYQKDPDFHARADHWYATASVWTKQKWVQLKESANKPPQHEKPKPIQQSPLVILPASTDPSSEEPAAVQATQPASKPSPWDRIYNPAASRNSAPPAHPTKVDMPPPAPVEPSTASVIIEPPSTRPPAREGTLDEVRTLYRAALDAEGQHDYVTAVQKFEQIKEFSKTLWPGDLELRLKEAREQVH